MNFIRNNLANFITCIRLVGTVVLFFFDDLDANFFWVYSICGLTDILDGFVARKLKTESKIGSTLDSVADILFDISMITRIWPIMCKTFDTWFWIYIWSIAGLRILFYLFIAIKEKRFLSDHPLLNKISSFSLFMLPYFAVTKYFNIYGHFTALLALIACVNEIYCYCKKRKNLN